PPPPPPPPPPDTIAPSVAFVTPADGDSLIGSVTVETSASDNVGVSHVQFLLGGVALASPDSSAPYSILWDTDLHPDGVYTLSAVAYDTTGLQGSANITLYLTSPPPPPPPPPAAGTVNIYDDQLVAPWINASWGAVNTFNSTERVLEGTSAIKSVQNAWGAISVHNGNWGAPVNLNTSGYDSLRFAVYPETTGLSLAVSFGNDIGGSFTRVTRSNLPSNTWTVISIPVAALNASGQVVHRLTIQNSTSARRTYHVDEVELTVKPAGTASSTMLPGTEAESMVPERFSLAQNYPNPFNPVSIIRYSLPTDGHVRIAIYNMVGQEVAVSVDRDQEAGTWEVAFDAVSLPSGVYTYRITAGAFTDAKKMVLIR
ncbi:MAG TPA: Ig-like domain-containing protein, partial [Bacteroidota bacterium]|nr:Ig-like domain-containing protein [Bacteroidota bacterium]